LHDVQQQINRDGYNDTLMQQEKGAQRNLDEALHKEEVFWLEKSKVKWHQEGDRNTSYFHRVTKIKNTTKLITSLKDGENLITYPNQIADHTVAYFESLFCTNVVL